VLISDPQQPTITPTVPVSAISPPQTDAITEVLPSTQPSPSPAFVDHSSSGPAGLEVAERVPGSVSAATIAKQKEDELNAAIEVAKQKAVAASPSSSPAPAPAPLTEEPMIVENADPNIGLMFNDNDKDGASTPEFYEPILPAHPPPEPIELPSMTASISPSPSVSPSLTEYEPTIETEFAECDDQENSDILPSPLPDMQHPGEMMMPETLVTKPNDPSQIHINNVAFHVPVFSQLPSVTQESDFDPRKLDTLVPTTNSNGAMIPENYQTFSLKNVYVPQPGVQQSFRKVSLAGLDMGVYKPTLQRLQEIHESASELAGDILTTENPLNDIRSTEEFRANELALNVTWALMNDPSIPKKSEPEIPDREDVVRVEEIAAVPVPSIVKPALIPRAVNMTRAIRLNVSSDMANLRNFDALPAGSEAEATILSATRYVSAAVSQVDAVADGSLTVPAPVVEVASVPEVVELSPVQVSATEPNVAVMAAAPQVPLNDMDETVSISRYTTSTMQNEGEEVYEKQSPAEVADVSEAARIRFIGNSGDFVRVRGVVPTLAKSANVRFHEHIILLTFDLRYELYVLCVCLFDCLLACALVFSSCLLPLLVA